MLTGKHYIIATTAGSDYTEPADTFIALTKYRCDDIVIIYWGQFKVKADNMIVYTTTQDKQLEQTYQGEISEIELPEKSIMTVVFE